MTEILILLVFGLVCASILALIIALVLALQLRQRVARLEAAVWKQRPGTLPPHLPPVMTAVPPTPPLPTTSEEPAARAAACQEVRPQNQPPAAGPAPVTEARLDALERLVGTRWLSWAGALVLLVGIAFLLKFLYDSGWIGPAGRVAIGMGFGAGLLFLGEIWLRRSHNLLSQSVSAAGCGALFLTTYLSFKFYDFGGRPATFALLCWFAFFTVTLAVIRRGRILAFLGLVGAYTTPYLLSTGQDQAEELFIYLAALAIAVSFVETMRGWGGIPSLSLGWTWFYYAGWYYRFYEPERLPVAVAGAVGLIIFSGVVALARGLWSRNAVRTEGSVVLAAGAILGLYYLWEVLVAGHPQALGFILCGIALGTLAALRAARLRRASSPILENQLFGLSCGSLLMVIPACLEADGAMIAWALGAVVIADMGAGTRRLIPEIATGVCLVAGIWIGLTQDVTHTGAFIPVGNRVFLAWFCVILAWFLVGMRYLRRYPSPALRRTAALGLQVASSFMLIALLTYEARAWFRGEIRLPGADRAGLLDWRTVALCLLWSLYPCIWLRWAPHRPKLWTLAAAHYVIFCLACLGVLPVFHHRGNWVFLNPVFLAALFLPAAVFWVSGQIQDGGPRVRYGLQIIAHLLCVTLISVELYQGLRLSDGPPASSYWMRMALISAAWAAYATVVLGIGVSRSLQAWRWLALGLLGATLLKVFFFDMAEVRQLWRVLSFMVLGALLMSCSYVYSRHERRKRLAAACGDVKGVTP